MIPVGLLASHLAAVVVVWGLVILAGMALRGVLPVSLGRTATPLFGLVYWAIILYLLPVSRSLDLAIGVAILCGLSAMFRAWKAGHLFDSFNLPAASILLVGLMSYGSIFLANYTPIGVDAAYVGASARMFELHGGYPATYDPWFPELVFPRVNFAIPTIGAAAMRLGAEPASVGLAMTQLSYGLWLLAIFQVLRFWVAPRPSAVLALISVWGSRWAQNTVGWGGFPTIAGVSAGLLASRMLLEFLRDTSWPVRIATGLSIVAVPLVHGVAAAVWLYSIGPITAAIVLGSSPHKLRALIAMLCAGGVAAAVLAIYLAANYLPMTPELADYTRNHILLDAPSTGSFPKVIPVIAEYFGKYGGEPVAALGWLGWLGLLLTRQWRAAAATLLALGTLIFLVLNIHYWVLPGSYLLYSNRVVYWVAPLAAVTMALAWQRMKDWPWYHGVLTGCVTLFLGYGLLNHVQQHQFHALKPTVKRDQWEALVWCRNNLPPADGVFLGATGSAAHLIPLVTNHGSTAWQMHHLVMDERDRIMSKVVPRYAFSEVGYDLPIPAGATARFRNDSVTIWELSARP